MKFGTFIWDLIHDLGITPPQLAQMLGKHHRTVYRWREEEARPRDATIVKIADALCVPLDTFRDAAAGIRSLPSEYRDRSKWKARVGASGSKAVQESGVPAENASRVLAWYQSAPAAVRHAVEGDVPEGMEVEYLRKVNDYFRDRLGVGKSGKKRK